MTEIATGILSDQRSSADGSCGSWPAHRFQSSESRPSPRWASARSATRRTGAEPKNSVRGALAGHCPSLPLCGPSGHSRSSLAVGIQRKGRMWFLETVNLVTLRLSLGGRYFWPGRSRRAGITYVLSARRTPDGLDGFVSLAGGRGRSGRCLLAADQSNSLSKSLPLPTSCSSTAPPARTGGLRTSTPSSDEVRVSSSPPGPTPTAARTATPSSPPRCSVPDTGRSAERRAEQRCCVVTE